MPEVFMKDSIKRFLSQFEDIKLNSKSIEECKLPENSWFLDDTTIICNSRKAVKIAGFLTVVGKNMNAYTNWPFYLMIFGTFVGIL